MRRFLLSALLGLFALSAHAEAVQIKPAGLALNGNLELAPGKTVRDGVVLMTHGTMGHGGMEIMRTLQSLLRERGYSSLAINLSYAVDNREGMLECSVAHAHQPVDALDEIGAWLGWLKQQGTTQVTLLGHSRGGNQVAWFGAERDDPLIRSLVLIAPATGSADALVRGYLKNFGQPLQPSLNTARALVAKGRGSDWMQVPGFLYCPKAKATAAAFSSYYTWDERMNTPNLIPRLKKPVLVVAGSDDTVSVDVDKAVAPIADGQRVKLLTLAGADHFFRDLYAEDIADAVAAFIVGN